MDFFQNILTELIHFYPFKLLKMYHLSQTGLLSTLRKNLRDIQGSLLFK